MLSSNVDSQHAEFTSLCPDWFVWEPLCFPSARKRHKISSRLWKINNVYLATFGIISFCMNFLTVSLKASCSGVKSDRDPISVIFGIRPGGRREDWLALVDWACFSVLTWKKAFLAKENTGYNLNLKYQTLKGTENRSTILPCSWIRCIAIKQRGFD